MVNSLLGAGLTSSRLNKEKEDQVPNTRRSHCILSICMQAILWKKEQGAEHPAVQKDNSRLEWKARNKKPLTSTSHTSGKGLECSRLTFSSPHRASHPVERQPKPNLISEKGEGTRKLAYINFHQYIIWVISGSISVTAWIVVLLDH